MASSYGKRTWFHELVGIISLLSMIACFLMLDHKPCQIPLLPREELSRWTTKPITGTEISTKSLREKNQTLIAEQMELFIENYYDSLQIFQIIIGCWSIIIMLFGIINIVPKHEDFKVMTILLMVLIMGFAALFAFYTAFIAFHKPCRALTTTTTTSSTSTTSTTIKHQQEIIPMTRANLRQLRYYYSQQLLQQQNNSNHNQQQQQQQGLKSMILNTINNNNNNVNNQQQQQQQKNKFLTTILSKFWFNNNNSNQTNIIQLPSSPDQLIYMLEFRSIKDKRPVNVFEDEDDTMIRITLINSLVGFILLCSDFLFFFDSRQHMIEWRN
ncbi:hypothetical protein DERP_005103 [Dermatophagoides pteronyssinus]|uniref:Uncharacterized protein n=1 Tax=Dermatophagoides pteronyssinus TaxID=6956 RepID=A0ABQ8JTE5_DERPT|nr:hypothetical protein DERP_005103 [Dermatophagoides pteronyssinus]